MTKEEQQYILLTFQLHKLISENSDESIEGIHILEERELIDRNFSAKQITTMGEISAWCYALHEKDPKIAEKYRHLLFTGEWDSEK